MVAETDHSYDPIDRLTNIAHSRGANPIANYTQTYDRDSRITGITGTDGTATYNYDNTDQLTGADYSFQTDEGYTYDKNGNRTNTGYVTGTNNRLLEDVDYRYEYDAVGRRTSKIDKTTNEVTEYTWDFRDRLTGIVVRNASGTIVNSVQYSYDVYDQRIAKTVDPDGAGALPATTERYVYGTNQNIHLVFDGNGVLTDRYLHGNGIDQIEASEQVTTGTVLWALTDHLGSVRDVVDNTGTVRNHIVYDAFGHITSQTDSSVVFRYSYTGREFDKESNQYYYRARYYDQTIGRFISEDPIGFGGGDNNLYRYVTNNVLSYKDPTGNARIAGQLVLSMPPSHLYRYKAKITFGEILGTSALQLLPGSALEADYISESNFAAVIIKKIPEGSGTPSLPLPEKVLGNKVGFDDRGHILPYLLGGITNNSDNFFWQNRSINRGIYNQFGIDIANNVLKPTPKSCPLHFYRYSARFFYNRYSDNPLRPTAFSVTVSDHRGIVHRARSFLNPP